MEFDNECDAGTETLISCDDKTKTGHILTCAHNVYNKKTKKDASKMWFSLKDEDNKLLVTFKNNNHNIYPSYFINPTPSSGSDLAICSFSYQNMDDKLLKYRERSFGSNAFQTCFWPCDLWKFGDFDYIQVVGYLGEKGELWGQSVSGFKNMRRYEKNTGLVLFLNW